MAQEEGDRTLSRFLRLLRSSHAGGRLLRVLLPGILLVPLFLAFAERTGRAFGLYESTTGIILFDVVLILLVTVAPWFVPTRRRRQA